MRKGVKLKTEKKIELAQAICEKYASGRYTLESCCESEGVGEKTFYNWAKEVTEITEIFKAAQQKKDETFRKELKQKAKHSLEKLVEGFESIETFQEGIPDAKTGKVAVVKVTTKKRFVGPNPTAVIFALTNLDSEHFKHKTETEHKGRIQVENLEKLSEQELDEKIRDLEERLRK